MFVFASGVQQPHRCSFLRESRKQFVTAAALWHAPSNKSVISRAAEKESNSVGHLKASNCRNYNGTQNCKTSHIMSYPPKLILGSSKLTCQTHLRALVKERELTPMYQHQFVKTEGPYGVLMTSCAITARCGCLGAGKICQDGLP